MFNLEQSIADWRKQMLAAGIKFPVPLEELEIHLREEIERQAKSGLNAQTAFEFSIRQVGQPKVLKDEFKKTERASIKKAGIFAVLVGAVIILRILTEHPDAAHLRKNEQLEWLVAGVTLALFGLSNVLGNFKLAETRDVRLWKWVGITYSLFAVWISVLPLASLITTAGLNAAFSLTDRVLAVTALIVSCLSVLGWRYGCGILPVIRSRQARTSIGIACCLLGPGAMAAWVYCLAPQLGRFPAPLFLVLLTSAWTLMAILGGVGYGLTEAARRQTSTTNA